MKHGLPTFHYLYLLLLDGCLHSRSASMRSPHRSRVITFDGDNPSAEVRSALRRALLTPDSARICADYELLDSYGSFDSINASLRLSPSPPLGPLTYFSDAPPDERLRYLRAVKGIEIERGEALFNIGDAADAFYCVMYGSLNVVLDFARMAAPTLSDFEEILNRARVHASLLNPGGAGGAPVDLRLSAGRCRSAGALVAP
ncbi:hypothetical protein PybrP1_000706 [[Pythium] brassicae (nom. inval.)]|nr:hypothetical protein PybrP1_000706 [[Pythium] brassicae (nom. inval.)]